MSDNELPLWAKVLIFVVVYPLAMALYAWLGDKFTAWHKRRRHK